MEITHEISQDGFVTYTFKATDGIISHITDRPAAPIEREPLPPITITKAPGLCMWRVVVPMGGSLGAYLQGDIRFKTRAVAEAESWRRSRMMALGEYQEIVVTA